MARQLAISIAVANFKPVSSQVSRFPRLDGAYAGAAQFTAWAREQGFDHVLHCDDSKGPVHSDPLLDYVEEAVDAGDVARLFVFFAGHGLTKFGDDIWLLSRDRDAIDVQMSVKNARSSGIPHIAFFADACRTTPDTDLFGIPARPIFPPRERNPRARVQVDQFYAVLPGNSAWERRPDDPTVPPYGIYTRCLMSALGGREPEVLEAVEGGREPMAVLSHRLLEHLDWVVPTVARDLADKYQWPDSIAGSYWKPNVLAWVPVSPEPSATTLPLEMADAADPTETTPSSDVNIGERRLPGPREWPFVAREINANRTAIGRANFETGAGLSVVGARIEHAVVHGGHQEVFPEGGDWHLRGRSGSSAAAAVLRLGGIDGEGEVRWAAAAIFPGYVGILRVGPTGVEHLAYLPARHKTALSLSETKEAVASAGALSRVWRLDRRDELVRTALDEDLNPTIAVLVAYALDRAGESDIIRTLFKRFTSSARVVPFDLALLAGPDAFDYPRIAPAYPLMSRGWALLEAGHVSLPAELIGFVRTRLAPSPWTTVMNLPVTAALQLAAAVPAKAMTPSVQMGSTGRKKDQGLARATRDERGAAAVKRRGVEPRAGSGGRAVGFLVGLGVLGVAALGAAIAQLRARARKRAAASAAGAVWSVGAFFTVAGRRMRRLGLEPAGHRLRAQVRQVIPRRRRRSLKMQVMGRLGMALGAAVGYVLGAKAGRKRYEQIASSARQLMENPQVKRVVESVPGTLGARVEQAVNKTVSVGKDRVAETAAAKAGQAKEAVSNVAKKVGDSAGTTSTTSGQRISREETSSS